MALKKTLCSYRKPDGEWEPQRDIEMHTIEEETFLAEWKLNDLLIKLNDAPSKEQEHDWLIEEGVEFVKKKRAEWQEVCDKLKPEIDAAKNYSEICHKIWHQHVDYCVSNKLNPDTHDIRSAEDAVIAKKE